MAAVDTTDQIWIDLVAESAASAAAVATLTNDLNAAEATIAAQTAQIAALNAKAAKIPATEPTVDTSQTLSPAKPALTGSNPEYHFTRSAKKYIWLSGRVVVPEAVGDFEAGDVITAVEAQTSTALQDLLISSDSGQILEVFSA